MKKVIIVLLFILSILMVSCKSPYKETRIVGDLLLVGKEFPAISVKTNRNTIFDTAEIEKPIVINCWVTWVDFCKKEMPDFQKAYEEYKDKIEFIAIDCDETREAVDNFLKTNEYEYTFPIGFDTAGKTVLGLGVTGFPTTIFVKKDKVVSSIEVGALSYTEFKDNIDKLLK